MFMESALYSSEFFLKRKYTDRNAAADLAACIKVLVEQKAVVLCIGSDKSGCDCFGPMVGRYLKEASSLCVYGTLDETVNAMNAGYFIDKIKYKYPDKSLIVVSSASGEEKQKGEICVKNSPFFLFDRVREKPRAVGNICITGITRIAGADGEKETRLSHVCEMASTLAKALELALD